ncbi:MAG: SpoIID/LytB domain-containing protein [Oscillospiraceae bacterium]|nr:SpoIID/LytB domain-containing protein [Oscillospiraceae bacterium]
MKKRFTIKRVIILLSLVLVYSAALNYIRVLAESTVLSDITFDSDSASALSDKEDEDAAVAESLCEEAAEVAMYYESPIEKAGIDSYEIFAPITTEVTAVTTVSETTEAVTTTTPPQTSATTAGTTTQATTVATTTVTTTTEATTEEDVEIDDDEDVDIDDEDETADASEDKSSDSSTLESLWYSISSSGTVDTNAADNLNNGKSYKDDTVTVYDSSSGRYVTDNAFDIVCQVTYSEVGTSMEEETIKAQAVAVYTYIKYYEAKGEYASVSLKSGVPDKIIECVEAVDGLAMYYDGEYILAVYCAATAGVTCSSENVWGGDRDYLQSVVSEYDFLDTDNYGRVTTYTAEELKKKIESKTNITLSDNYQNWIQILSYTDGGYVGNIAIDGNTTAKVSGTERTLTAYVFRTYILNIRSTCFTVSYSNGVFTFVTYGYGHGVGMSQEGANLYAIYGGYSFDQILHHYYTGVTIA